MDNYKSLFKPEQKIAAFDKIAEMMYNRNFGSASKPEFELLMFSEYMDAMIEKYKRGDSTVIDYEACSDYNIVKQLGITQERVKNLKIKKQARYPVEFKWKEALISIQNRIRYDGYTNKIIIPTPDPNLYNEIKNHIEENDGYIEIQRGQNIIKMRPEYFFMLMYYCCPEAKRSEIEKELKTIEEQNNLHEKTDKERSTYAIELSDKIFDILSDVSPFCKLSSMLKGIKLLLSIINANK